MSDQEKHDENIDNEEVDFASMLSEYDAGKAQDLKVGDPIEGQIISIGTASVYVDTGTKSDGVVERIELLDEEGGFHYQVGDWVKLYVVSVNESEVILSKALSGAGQASMIEEAFRSRTPVEGKVTGIIKGGFSVDIMGKRAFCPVSQMDVKYVEDQEVYLNDTHHFRITRYEEGGRNIVVSRRELLNEQIEQERKAFLETISAGSIVQGSVSKLMSFGAFIELAPGVEGMAHISELSWSRVEKPEDAVSPGESVKAKVLRIEDQGAGKAPKISLSIKQMSGDPWDDLENHVKAGEQLSGKVVRLAPFGAFVEVAHGLEGLVHLSEMSHTKRIVKADEVVKAGDVVQVVVKSVDPDKKRISLSIKDALGDPWVGVSVRYTVGSTVKGTLEKKENFGLLINLEPGITALLPASVMNASANASEYERLKPGDLTDVVISSVDEEKRRISLATVGDDTNDNWQSYSGKSDKPMGTMEAVFMEALKKQKK